MQSYNIKTEKFRGWTINMCYFRIHDIATT